MNFIHHVNHITTQNNSTTYTMPSPTHTSTMELTTPPDSPTTPPPTGTDPKPASSLPKSTSTTSLPILHPLTTIPENRTNTLPTHSNPGITPTTAHAGHTPIHPSRARHPTFRYPVYPDTPYSTGPSYTAMPYTPRPRGNTTGSQPISGSGPAFFVWPSGLPRALTSRLKPTTPILPTTTTTTPAKPALPASPADSEITREFEHEVRLQERRRQAEFPRRLLTALFGGVAVVAPMVVMSLGRSLVKSLVTSSVAMLVFGVVLAWTSAADEASLMVATAGYAAVLAVFVAVGDGTGG